MYMVVDKGKEELAELWCSVAESIFKVLLLRFHDFLQFDYSFQTVGISPLEVILSRFLYRFWN